MMKTPVGRKFKPDAGYIRRMKRFSKNAIQSTAGALWNSINIQEIRDRVSHVAQIGRIFVKSLELIDIHTLQKLIHHMFNRRIIVECDISECTDDVLSSVKILCQMQVKEYAAWRKICYDKLDKLRP